MSACSLSYWGWGFADRFPDREARTAIAEQVAALVGFTGLSPEEPRPLESIDLGPPRFPVPEALRAFSCDDRLARITHTYGRAYPDLVRGFRGDFGPAPDVVATPRSEAEVSAVLEWASKERVAVVPFGGGTSVVGGVELDLARHEHFAGFVSLDTRAQGRVLEVDPVSRAARIQAGATGPRLEAQLQPHGFSLRHFPQSFEFSTLGGWIATRSGGHFATLYTHIDDLVESVRTVTPAGVMDSRRLPASGAGPSPDRLMLGSEGALGVITEAWLRVHQRPRFRATASVRFAELDAGVNACRAIAQAGLYPSNCRLLDSREAALHAVAVDGSHILVVGFESADHALTAWMDRALALCALHGGRCQEGARYRDESAAGQGSTAANGDAAESWRRAFLDAPYLQNVMVSLGVIADTFETSCTWDRFADLHRGVIDAVRSAIASVCGGERGRISCRFTHVYPDGPAPYYTFLAPAKRGAELEQWSVIKRAASDALLAHGATITHHHAVGRTHRPWYDRQRPELFAAALRATKQTLDPAGILNPGVLID